MALIESIRYKIEAACSFAENIVRKPFSILAAAMGLQPVTYGIILCNTCKMWCIKIACIIVIITEMISFSKCESCTFSVLRCAYGFSGTAIIYCIIMICMHLMLIWAIKNGNSSMVLIWVVVTSIWLLQTFCLTLVLLCMFMAEASFVTWIISFTFEFIGFGMAAYVVFVGFGLWLELKPLTATTV